MIAAALRRLANVLDSNDQLAREASALRTHLYDWFQRIDQNTNPTSSAACDSRNQLAASIIEKVVEGVRRIPVQQVSLDTNKIGERILTSIYDRKGSDYHRGVRAALDVIFAGHKRGDDVVTTRRAVADLLPEVGDE